MKYLLLSQLIQSNIDVLRKWLLTIFSIENFQVRSEDLQYKRLIRSIKMKIKIRSSNFNLEKYFQEESNLKFIRINKKTININRTISPFSFNLRSNCNSFESSMTRSFMVCVTVIASAETLSSAAISSSNMMKNHYDS